MSTRGDDDGDDDYSNDDGDEDGARSRQQETAKKMLSEMSENFSHFSHFLTDASCHPTLLGKATGVEDGEY